MQEQNNDEQKVKNLAIMADDPFGELYGSRPSASMSTESIRISADLYHQADQLAQEVHQLVGRGVVKLDKICLRLAQSNIFIPHEFSYGVKKMGDELDAVQRQCMPLAVWLRTYREKLNGLEVVLEEAEPNQSKRSKLIMEIEGYLSENPFCSDESDEE